jgi:hypothetical protein
MDGADASTTFTDSSLAPHTVTPAGNAQIDTAQSKFGGASGLFDGTDDYLSLEDSPDWYFGTGDFTIDFWVRFNSLPNVGNSEWCVYSQYVDASNRIRFGFYSTDGINVSPVATVISGGDAVLNRGPVATIVVNTWYHFAFVRSGSTHYIFQDGVQLDSAPMSGVVPDLASSLYVGTLSGAAQYFNGWLDEFRVSKGVARWTSNFTPPTAPYSPSEEPGYGVFYDYNYTPFLSTAAGADDWGDKANYRTKDLMRAISLTIPHNLFVEPNRVIRFAARIYDRRYETGMVMHQGDEGHSVTVVEAAATIDLE